MLKGAAQSMEADIIVGAAIRLRGFWCVWVIACALIIGLISFWSEQSWLLRYFLPLAYTALILSVFWSMNVWNDLLNPLGVVLVLGVIRFFGPGLMLLNGVAPPDEVGIFFQSMKLSDRDWLWGHALALVGSLTLVLGWFLVQPGLKAESRLKFSLASEIKYAAILGMVAGSVGLWVFVLSNASSEVVVSGGFRAATIQEGTGKYFFLAYFLVAGSTLLSCYCLGTGRILHSLVPNIVTMLFYWVLGGRSRALFSLAAGLAMIWYVRTEKRGWKKLTFRPVHVLITPFVLLSILWLAYLGSLYRGELGAAAFAEGLSLAGLWEYIQHGVFTDLGQLHSLAGAIAIGPGVLDGQTFYGSLGWPVGYLLPIPARSAGIFIVEELRGFPDGRVWAVNPSLIGDAYLNFGLPGVFMVMLIFGAFLKLLYSKFREGRVHLAIYVLALLLSLQICFFSIEKWPQALTTLTFTYLLILFGNSVLRSKRANLRVYHASQFES